MKFRLFWLTILFFVVHLAYGAQFLSVADIHFDPFTSCLDSNSCPLIDKLQQAPITEWKNILNEADKSEPIYKRDTNFKLFESGLANASRVANEQHAKFVVVLGDFLAHSYRAKYFKFASSPSQASYEIFVNKTFQFLISEFRDYFPYLNIYPTIGNNDSYNEDYSVGNSHFYQEISPYFASLINETSARNVIMNQFSQYGYFALDIPNQKNLRLIVINSVLFSDRAQGEGISILADQELKWLNSELKNISIKRQKALIVMHIPDGIDVYASLKSKSNSPTPFWKKEYSLEYEFLLKTYSQDIMGVLVAHLHTDGFQLLPYAKPVVVSFTPSISPNIQTNPAFKVYQYDTHNLDLKDFKTYFYSLSSLKGWQEEYDFNIVYQPWCVNCKISNGMNIKKEFLKEHYIKYFDVGTLSQPIKNQWDPYYRCAIHNTSIEDYNHCVSAVV